MIFERFSKRCPKLFGKGFRRAASVYFVLSNIKNKRLHGLDVGIVLIEMLPVLVTQSCSLVTLITVGRLGLETMGIDLART